MNGLKLTVLGLAAISASLASTPVWPLDAKRHAQKLPAISGDYNRARPELIRRGYLPLRVKTDERSKDCKDWGARSACSPSDLPEGECASDVPACNFFWRAPRGGVIRVMTQGELRAKIVGVAWAGSEYTGSLERLPRLR